MTSDARAQGGETKDDGNARQKPFRFVSDEKAKTREPKAAGMGAQTAQCMAHAVLAWPKSVDGLACVFRFAHHSYPCVVVNHL